MKILTLSVEEVRELENKVIHDFGMPSFLLMENAGRGLAAHLDVLLNRFPRTTPVCILCGHGKNAGDGFVAARHLSQKHPVIYVYLFSDPKEFKDDTLRNYEILSKLNIPIYPISDFKKHRQTLYQRTPLIILDAIVGTGFRPPLDPQIVDIIHEVTNLKKFHNGKVNVVAVDIPTGLSGNEGPNSSDPNPAIMQADLTVTFGFIKKGLLDPHSKPFVGRLEVVEIGIPEQIIKVLGYS